MTTATIDPQQVIFSDDALLKTILVPYKAHCHYLKKASVEFRPPAFAHLPLNQQNNLLSARGEFSIPESCYIVDTGHFNAVEFNICYNQLGYYLLAECVQHQKLNDFLDWDIEEYRHHQLSHILIVEFSSSFHKPMRSDRFDGYIEIKKIVKKKKILFLQTVCGFKDNLGGSSSGKVFLAIVDK